MAYTRRDFLKAGALLVSAGATVPAFLARTADIVEAAGATNKILVVVQLAGGNDGLNTVVPFSDPLYLTNRPTIGLPTASVLPITDTLGLNPGMTKLKARYDAGQVAIVQNVGYPNPNRSHFRATDIWETGVPEKVASDGWIGRYLGACCSGTGAAASQAEIDAWAVGSTLPLTLWTTFVLVPTIKSVSTFTFQTDGEYPDDRLNKLDAFKAIYAEQSSTRPYDDFIRSVGSDALATTSKLQTIASTYKTNVTFPANSFGNDLKTVSQLIAADLGTRIFYVSTSGFDTHANQVTAHQSLLQRVSDGIDAFLLDMADRGRLQDVVVLCFSEFGRRVKQNGSNGTDHGTAAPMFIVGQPIKGGLYGENPNLADLTSGDLKYKIDFRSVYATILGTFLGGDPSSVLGGTYAPLPFIA